MDRILGGLPTTQPLSDIPPVEEPILGGDVSSIFRPTETYTDKAKGLADAGLSLFGALVHGVPAQFMGAMGPEYQAKRFRPPQTPAGERYFETAAEALGKVGEAFPLQPSAFTTPMNVLAAPAAAQAASKASQTVKNAEITQRVNQALQAAGGRLEKAVEAQVNKTMEQGGLPAEILQGMTQNTASQVIKGKGGNWLEGTVERALKPLRRVGVNNTDPAEQLVRLEEKYGKEGKEEVLRSGMYPSIKEDAALNNWIDRNLANYVKKEMGTPEDPVRKLAEQGIVHAPIDPDNLRIPWFLRSSREFRGYKPEGEASSLEAKNWETLADEAIRINTPESIRAGARGEEGLNRKGFEKILEENPWLQKLDPQQDVFKINQGWASSLGFNHIVDVLREDLQTGRIRPEQLNKVSMEQAVRRTYEYDQEKAKEAARAALQQQEGLPVVKSYPEGYKWLELHDKNDAKKTEEALSYEGKTMGHCVGSYCPDVLEGKSQIFSLRDAKGEPHVTIEVKPAKIYAEDDVYEQFPGGVTDALKKGGPKAVDQYIQQKLQQLNADQKPTIIQIKGKGNRAPKEDYLPFVQDFVKSGNWAQINDVRNAGLRRYTDVFNDNEQRMIESLNLPVPDHHWLTGDQIQTLHNAIVPQGKRLKYDAYGNIVGENFKDGGLATNTDTIKSRLTEQGMPEDKAFTQALRLANEVQMAGGGSLRGLKNLPAAAKASKVTKPVDVLPSEDSKGKERLYHGGNIGLEEIKGGTSPGNIFGGIFASQDRKVAASHGDGSVYRMDVPKEAILSQQMLDSMDDLKLTGVLKKAMPWLKDEDINDAFEAVIKDAAHKVDDDKLMRIFREDSSGEASWEAQRIRGEVANLLGKKAVEMADEHGTSYLVLPGVKPIPDVEYNEKDITKAKGGLASLKGLPAAARAAKATEVGTVTKTTSSPIEQATASAIERLRKDAENNNTDVIASDAAIENAIKRSAERFAKDNPKLSIEEVAKKAERDAIAKLKWERQEKPRLEAQYGALQRSSYSDPATKRMMNVPAEVEKRIKRAEDFLKQPTEPWTPPRGELQAFDRSLIKDAIEGFPGVTQTRFPRYEAPRASGEYIDEIYSDPRNRELIKGQIQRGLPLGGETFYGSLYPLKVAAMERGIPAEKFEQFVYQTAPASARNSIMNEMAVGQFMRDMAARGLPLDENTVKSEMAKFKQQYGTGLPLMPVHREGVRQVIEGNLNMRDLLKADIPTNYKIPTYGTQKAGDFGKSMVLDVHESAGQTQGSRYHPYFTEQGGFSPTEYGPAESRMLDIANELGIPGGMAQAGRWFGGGELTGLKSPRGDALDLLERQAAYTMQGMGINPTPKNVREYILKMIDTGEGVLMPYFKSTPMPDYRVEKKDGGLAALNRN